MTVRAVLETLCTIGIVIAFALWIVGCCSTIPKIDGTINFELTDQEKEDLKKDTRGSE